MGKPLRKDKAERHKAFCDLIQKEVAEAKEEFEGYLWAVRSQDDWADLLGVSVRTIGTLSKIPPIQKTVTMVEGRKAVLYRVGEHGKMTQRHIANIMNKLWRKKTGKSALPKEYGMLNGLAENWPEGYQIEIFNDMLENWPSFMAALKGHIFFEKEVNGKEEMYELFLEFPCISVLRKFPHVAADAYLTHGQVNGKFPDPPYPFYYEYM